MSILVKSAEATYQLRSFVYSGGESHISGLDLPASSGTYDGVLDVVARVQSAQDLMELALVDEVLSRHAYNSFLVLPYLPYSRQDRVTVENEAFSLRAVAKILNGFSFLKIKTYDAHSPAGLALISRIQNKSHEELVLENESLRSLINTEWPILLAPDKGAHERCSRLASELGLALLQGHKSRDIFSGKITSLTIPSADVAKGRSVLICDDICDGGATFTELAKILRAAGAARVILYVTHGIFSRGYDPFEGLIDRIYTTNTFIPKMQALAHQVPVFINPVIQES